MFARLSSRLSGGDPIARIIPLGQITRPDGHWPYCAGLRSGFIERPLLDAGAEFAEAG